MNLEDIFAKLVSYESISPHHVGCMDFISHFLKEAGFTVYLKEFGPDKVVNLYARYGSGEENICFAGHIDVVPPGESWGFDPFSATRIGDKIYGRGAVDMKGAVAAMMLAAKNFIGSARAHNRVSISFLLTSDEEGSAEYGTKAMLEWLSEEGHKIDFTIVGEPTSEEKICDVIKIGRRGSVNCELKIIGKQGHVAYPRLALNPIHIMVAIAKELTELKLDDGVGMFDPSHLEVTSIDVGNEVTNVIPAEANMKFNIRYNSEDMLRSNNSIEAIIAKHATKYHLTMTQTAEPFLCEPGKITNILCDVIEEECGYRPKFSTSGGTSDARFIKNYSSVCEVGLKSSMAHKIDEYVEFSDLQKLYNVYYSLLRKIFFE